jgi:transposase InsO family protein
MGGTIVIDERTRHQLHGKLDEVLGAEEAATLMAHLPPVGWSDVATKRDLNTLEAATRRDLDHLEAALRHDIADVKLEIASAADRLRAEFYKDQTGQTRILISWVLGAIVTVAGIAFGAAQLS